MASASACATPCSQTCRLPPCTGNWWPGTFSLLVGALSHVVWDAFTHRRGAVVHVWPALAHNAMHVGGYALPPYFLLQHMSTAFGLLCLAIHIRSRLREAPWDRSAVAATPLLSVKARTAVIAALSLATAAAVWWTFARDYAPPLSAYNFVCGTISAASIMAMTYALAWHACLRFGRNRHRKHRLP